MLEKLIENQLLLPLMAVCALVLAVAFFKLGWSFKAFGSRRRETVLQKDIRDAKVSVPQLESNLRSREQLIVRLQDDLQAQRDRMGQLQSEHAERERQLRSVQTEVRHLTNELSAIKGKSIDSRDIDLDLLGGQEISAAENLSPLAAKLKTAEQLYDKMKAAVIERSARIEVLERLLKEAESGISSGEPAMLSSAEIDALHRRLDQSNRSISELNAQVAQLKQDKEMVEELAQKRSKANRSLKDSKSDVEARKTELEQAVETHQKTISDRELSIHLRDSVAEAHRLMRVNQTKDEALAEAIETQRSLEQAISQREAKMLALQAELDKASSLVVLLRNEIADLTRQSQEQLAVSRDNLDNSGNPEEESDSSVTRGPAQLLVAGDLESELKARHRAHQDGDVVGLLASARTERLVPPGTLDSPYVADARNDA